MVVEPRGTRTYRFRTLAYDAPTNSRKGSRPRPETPNSTGIAR